MHATHRNRGQRAEVELAFGADVEQARTKRNGGGEAGENQRGGAGQGFGERKARAEGAIEEQGIGLPDRRAGPGHQQCTHAQRDEHSNNRGEQHGPP